MPTGIENFLAARLDHPESRRIGLLPNETISVTAGPEGARRTFNITQQQAAIIANMEIGIAQNTNGATPSLAQVTTAVNARLEAIAATIPAEANAQAVQTAINAGISGRAAEYQTAVRSLELEGNDGQPTAAGRQDRNYVSVAQRSPGGAAANENVARITGWIDAINRNRAGRANATAADLLGNQATVNLNQQLINYNPQARNPGDPAGSTYREIVRGPVPNFGEPTGPIRRFSITTVQVADTDIMLRATAPAGTNEEQHQQRLRGFFQDVLSPPEIRDQAATFRTRFNALRTEFEASPNRGGRAVPRQVAMAETDSPATDTSLAAAAEMFRQGAGEVTNIVIPNRMSNPIREV